MTTFVDIQDFLARASDHVLIDVRSPSEFNQGHIPGAINVPLFSDAERAEIGVCYKEQGRDKAVLRGLDLVGPTMRHLVEQVRAASSPGSQVFVHCWRGGMRSQSVAWLLEQVNHSPFVLKGGYKSYRRAAHEAFGTARQLIVLSGMTGAGKTRALHELMEAGEQVLDLEHLAHHRGSSFGAIGLPPQPSCEQFENYVFHQLRFLDPDVPTWVEDESPSIGRVRVPEQLWWMMRRSQAIFLDLPRDERAAYLVEEYGSLDRPMLEAAILRLRRKLGGLRTEQSLQALREDRLDAVALELLAYYDKTYLHAAQRRPRDHVMRLHPPVTVDRLRDFARELSSNKSHCGTSQA